METNSILAFLACIIVLFILGKFFLLPLKKILKLIANSILGGGLICLINLIGASFSFHIGLNIGTSIFVGILGVPRSNIVNYFKINDWIKLEKVCKICNNGIINGKGP